jgi:hypothetical protein
VVPVLAVGTLVCALLKSNEDFRVPLERDMAEQGRQTQEVIGQLRAANFKIRPHSRVVFLNQPFKDWDLIFIAELWFRDHTLQFWLPDKNPLSDEQIQGMDYIYRCEKDRIVQVKP